MAEPTTTTLLNVRIFNGHTVLPPSTLTMSGAFITSIIASSTASSSPSSTATIDCHSYTLLPGFIDSHIHLNGIPSLHALLASGITTALDMASFPISDLVPLRSLPGLPFIRSAGIPATCPGSIHSKFPNFPTEALVSSSEQAAQFVADRVAEGSDYIKLVADVPGPDQATLDALVKAAHAHGKLAIAHAAKNVPYAMAQEAGVDIVTHVPLDTPLDAAAVTRMIAEGRIAVPTLTMMEAIVQNLQRPGLTYAPARESVKALYEAGVPILAGTDANTRAGSPSPVQHGESLHRELELLVEAGLSHLDACRAATVLPAKYFKLDDRGVVGVGKRADLVLVEGDPLKDIKATRRVVEVWCAGVRAEGGKLS